ncbi:hypothetical protein Efla_006090 [Eimeria flavescens]
MPVKRDPAAAKQALNYMTEVVKQGCPFKHSQGSGFGENLFMSGASDAACASAVGAWYSEIRVFNGKYPGGKWTLEAGHFTQLMWSTSTKLGCAKTLQCQGKTIIVCNYGPPGNWVGQPPFSEEVWDSIMEASGAPSSSGKGPLTLLMAAVVATAFATILL